MTKLAALIPKPRVNLMRYHDVLAPNSKQRIYVTPSKRGKGNTHKHELKDKGPPVVNSYKSITWVEQLKWVFTIDVTICSHCGGAVNIIACIEDPSIVNKIFAHLDAKYMAPSIVDQIPEARAGQMDRWFD